MKKYAKSLVSLFVILVSGCVTQKESAEPTVPETPPSRSRLADTEWRVTPAPMSWIKYDITMNADGTLLVPENNSSEIYKGEWHHYGNTVVWSIPEGLRFRGTLSGDMLTGKLTSRSGTADCICYTGETRRIRAVNTKKAEDARYDALLGYMKSVTSEFASAAKSVAEQESRATADGAYKCPRCEGYGKIDPTNSSQNFAEKMMQGFITCPRCDGTGWLRSGTPYNPRR